MSFRKLVPSLVLACLTAGASAGPNMRPGLWETTVRTEMPGMPIAVPPVTTSSCVRETEVVPQTEQPGQECEMTDQSVDGDRVSWQIRCNSQGTTMIGNGEITYAGDTYTGQVRMNMQQGGQSMQMTQSLEGRRLGDCQ
ncbi:MAG: DUF3617 domain-containing protein [Chromatiales bacterium]|jgi:hypothetical protein